MAKMGPFESIMAEKMMQGKLKPGKKSGKKVPAKSAKGGKC